VSCLLQVGRGHAMRCVLGAYVILHVRQKSREPPYRTQQRMCFVREVLDKQEPTLSLLILSTLSSAWRPAVTSWQVK
jgi:hypothetical protein